MEINVNGRPLTAVADLSLQQLLQQQGVNGKAIAVAINDDVVHREQWPTLTLQPGDRVTLVTVVAGG
ncbi:sulfur carrier protein ThiS [Idiomarina aquatica]|uniref:Thiamine biosynthesis protein ThiS n=1 Tax=Idiomarina aquatica TaxID=1327752 RepID=A0AA94EDP2_9GAMM|nr:sulfur carrier protein ThiS [Idiomarina aquatica]RUO42550.1 thiamine biosynthesis protein ThiS [Idiomarina aquatica]